jgi:hypothetical protein
MEKWSIIDVILFLMLQTLELDQSSIEFLSHPPLTRELSVFASSIKGVPRLTVKNEGVAVRLFLCVN